LQYAAIAVVVNYAAGRGDSRAGIDLRKIEEVLGESMVRVINILKMLVGHA